VTLSALLTHDVEQGLAFVLADYVTGSRWLSIEKGLNNILNVMSLKY
jgi:hypothetical protein